MTKIENFITLVSAEATFACLTRTAAGLRPAAILAVAMQCPASVLHESPEQLRHQSQQLVDWFSGGPDPSWLPESLLYEEIEEEVEELVPMRRYEEEEYEYVEPEESYYEQ